MSLQLIENWQDKSLYCMFCGTNKSVKYLVTITDQKDDRATVCCCNRCIVFRTEEEKNINATK